MSGIPEIEILHEDEYLLVVSKPAGILVHPTRLDASETVDLLGILKNQTDQILFPAHRLDKATSGVLVLAKTKPALSKLNEGFAGQLFSKQYLALVRGWCELSGRIDYPLKQEDRPSNKAKIQDAVSEYERFETFEFPKPIGRYSCARFSLVKLIPKTGRRHQLRRHMAHLRHPILGDTTHGDGKQNQFARRELDCNRLMLAATELGIIHPVSGKSLKFTCSPGSDFEKTIRRLGA